MAVLAFIAGAFFGGITVLIQPWLIDIGSWSASFKGDLFNFTPWSQLEALDSFGKSSFIEDGVPRAPSRQLIALHEKTSKLSTDSSQGTTTKVPTTITTTTAPITTKEGTTTKVPTTITTTTAPITAREANAHYHEDVHDHEEVQDHEEHSHDIPEVQLERGISIMTLGAVAFQMGLFYLVNHSDEDMRRYAYQIIGETISIFCAVLLFNACYAWVEELFATWREAYHVAIFVLMCSFFYVAMEVTVMLCARVRGHWALRHVVSRSSGKELHVLHCVMSAKTFGAGIAQICGAATIQSFGRFQVWAYLKVGSTALFVCSVPIAFLVHCGMMWLMMLVRQAIIYHDGMVDSAEWTWVHISEQCEHEICGLCIGFLLANVFRVAITGTFSHLLSGMQQPNGVHAIEIYGIGGLFVTGVLFACASFAATIIFYGSIDKDINKERLRSDTRNRLFTLLVKCTGFTFAWCMCFSHHLLAIEVAIIKGPQLRLILSLLQSVASLVVIRIVDFFNDMDCTGAPFNKALVTFIEYLAVAMGLSWEYAFHECVHVAVEYLVEDPYFPSKDPKVWSLILCVALCMMVLPAYRLYIVPTRYELIEDFEHHHYHKEMEFRRVSSGAPRIQVDQMTSSQMYQRPIKESWSERGDQDEQKFTFRSPPSLSRD